MKIRHLLTLGLSAGLISTLLFSCTKDSQPVQKTNQNAVSAEALQTIANLGFNTDNVIKRGDNYLVEGDILLTPENLSEANDSPILRIAENEQYRTTNLVKKLPRKISISISNLPNAYKIAASNAITRYNGLNLTIKFYTVSNNGNIQITGFNEEPSGGYILLGFSGFPTSSGNPYNQIALNTNPAAYGATPNVNYITAVIQHEMGHCIGFRHTDYMNRAFSCGGSPDNEGSAGIGAIHIPGTPTPPDAGSWMLSCENANGRNFNKNDIIALRYLY